jgi:high-affinity iron transporter
MRAAASVVVGALLWLRVAPIAAAIDPAAAADVQRALTLLNVVAEEYREGVVDGRVVLPVEYGEATTLLEEAQARVRAAAPGAAAATEAPFAAVREALGTRAPLDQVRAGLDQIRAAIRTSTGIIEEVYPPAPPSASRGRALFAENCTPCHGARADGQGPQAARLNPPPANFTDAEFMRRETPFSFFNIISAGKGTSAMPAWGDAFTLQERWDLVSYLYTVQPGAATLDEGRRIYLDQCAGCHGASGTADARAAQGAPPLTVATLAEKTDDEIAAAIAQGTAGGPMPGYASQLSGEELRAVAAYVRLLSLGGDGGSTAVAIDADSARRFAGLLQVLTDAYRKALATNAPGAQPESAILLEQVRQQAPRVEAAVAARDRTAAAALSQQLDVLSAAIRERRSAAEVVALSAPLVQMIEAQFPETSSGPRVSPAEQLVTIRRLLDEALTSYRQGNGRAAFTVSDAYLLFDPLEKTLGVRDAGLARRAEARFAELRGVMGSSGHADDAASLVAALDADLDAARRALAPKQDAYAVALQSGFIILREGFEVVLIVGALLAYVRKAGLPTMRRSILYGTLGGVVASAVTAYAMVRVFEASGAAGDVLEGLTMLLASGVLFFVSYWLIARAEAERWQRYIQGKVARALATGNTVALAGAAFLAVYREGTETILFYQALIVSAPGAAVPVGLGLAGGGCGLAVVYVLYTRLGSRLPLRQFFFVTGGLLYYLAVVFAGKGVVELQGAGWVSTTPVPWVPHIDLIGLSPSVEALAAQGALLLCALYALVAALRRARQDAADERVAMAAAPHGGAKR